jgi:hypothetical protein
MWAGDCALGSLIASPLFLPVLFWQYARPLPLLSKEATKNAVSRMLTRAWADCAFSRQLSSSFTGPSKRYSLLYEPDHYIWIASIYFTTDFVNNFFNIIFGTSLPAWGTQTNRVILDLREGTCDKRP